MRTGTLLGHFWTASLCILTTSLQPRWDGSCPTDGVKETQSQDHPEIGEQLPSPSPASHHSDNFYSEKIIIIIIRQTNFMKENQAASYSDGEQMAVKAAEAAAPAPSSWLWP